MQTRKEDKVIMVTNHPVLAPILSIFLKKRFTLLVKIKNYYFSAKMIGNGVYQPLLNQKKIKIHT